MQRFRFVVWGEVIGLAPSNPSVIEPSNVVKEYGASVTPALKEVLTNLYLTIAYAEVFVERFSVKDDTLQEQEWKSAASISLPVFCNKSEAVREAVSKAQQSDKSLWKVSRWSVHNLRTFQALVDKIEGLVNTLDAITEPLGTLERQFSVLTNEIKSISDPTSTQLIRDVASFLKPSPLISKILEILDDVLQPVAGSTEAAITIADCSTESPMSGPLYVGTALVVDKRSSVNSTGGHQPAWRDKTLCEACSTISLAMLVHGFRHALNYDQVLQSSDSCRFCAFMLDAYKTQKCVNVTIGMKCDKSHRGKLIWKIPSDGPGVRFGMFKLDSSHYGRLIDVYTYEGIFQRP